MKKLLTMLVLLLVGSVVSAKQCVEYYRYNLSLNVANAAKADLESLISRGFKIVSFSLDYSQKCMVVVYDDMKK
ncbi:MAG: hypothetical protein J6Y78_09690 [Paludibacteraceae bacterium]|nr:hypothetical protein [Paludibacteraceae bacterium]